MIKIMRNQSAVALALAFFFTVFCFQAVAGVEIRLCPAGSYFDTWNEGCKKCSDGEFSNGTVPLTSCKSCPPGTIFEQLSGNTKCDACPAGTYEHYRQVCYKCGEGRVSAKGSSGESSCGTCLPGSYSPDKNPQSCRECPAGTYEVERNTCISCPSGTFSDYGAAECKTCPPGFYTANGQTECLACPEGTSSQEGSEGIESCGVCFRGYVTPDGNPKNCRECPKGTYEFNRSTCISCPAGTISPQRASSCKACNVGSYAANNGTSCVECPSGTWDANRTSCETCPAGTYSQAGKNDKCAACPPGYIAPSPGSTSCTTKCQAGFHPFNGLSCFPCGPGSFGTDGIECRQCPNGSISMTSSSLTCTQCQPGYVAVKGNTECQDEKEVKAQEEKKVQEEKQAQESAGKNDGSSGSSKHFILLEILGVGIIVALVFVGISLKRRKLEDDLERDVRMSLIDQPI